LSNLRETEKAHRELRAFHDFVDRSALLIDPESVEKRDPPEPDILCRHLLEGWTAFELADLCDANIASRLNRTDGPVVEVFMTSDPSLAIVHKKALKRIPVGASSRTASLVYSTGRIITPDDVIVPTIRPYVESHPERFRRVWFSGDSVHLVYGPPRAQQVHKLALTKTGRRSLAGSLSCMPEPSWPSPPISPSPRPRSSF